MESPLDHNPLWAAALGALEARFQAWSRARAGVPGDDARRRESRWRALADDLRRLGLDPATRDGVLGWAGARMEDVRPGGSGRPKTRLLHPMEREMLGTEAYGHLLDLHRLGLLDAEDFEQVLEHCAQLTRLPATLEQARALVRRVLAGRIAAQGFGTAH